MEHICIIPTTKVREQVLATLSYQTADLHNWSINIAPNSLMHVSDTENGIVHFVHEPNFQVQIIINACIVYVFMAQNYYANH